MARILSGGGQNSAGKPTTKTVGRPGFGRVVRNFRQSVRRLSISDPADGLLNTNDASMLSIGSYATLTTNLTGTNNDLTFTAKEAGTEGNSLRVRLLDPAGANQALAVSISGNDITVSLATNGSSVITSTASQVMAAVNAHTTVGNKIGAVVKTGDTGAGVVTAMAFTNLAGGAEGEMREALPPGLAKRPSSPTVMGREDQTVTFPDISQTGTKVSDRSTNKRLRKR